MAGDHERPQRRGRNPDSVSQGSRAAAASRTRLLYAELPAEKAQGQGLADLGAPSNFLAASIADDTAQPTVAENCRGI